MQHNRTTEITFGMVSTRFVAGEAFATAGSLRSSTVSELALQGRIAIITGAGSGLGAAFARRLAADGAHIVVNDLDEAAADAVAKEVDGETAVFDVTDAAAFDASVDDVVARHGRLDIMINNAGIAPPFNPARFDLAMANAVLRMEGRIDGDGAHVGAVERCPTPTGTA